MPWARYQSSPIGRSPGSVRLPFVYTGGCSRTSSRSGISPAWRRARSASWSAMPSRYGIVPSCATQSSATTRRLLSGSVDRDERFWPARIRWRLRGAWMWPTFVVVTLVDGLILHELPPVGTGVDLIPGILLATIVGVVAAGLAARPTVVSETEDTERNAKAFRELILERGDEELIHNLETANTVRLGEDFFRTCVARKDRRRYFCAFVDTSKHPADVDVDGSAEPNSVYKVR